MDVRVVRRSMGIALIVASLALLAVGAYLATWYMTLGWGYGLLAAGGAAFVVGLALVLRGRHPPALAR